MNEIICAVAVLMLLMILKEDKLKTNQKQTNSNKPKRPKV